MKPAAWGDHIADPYESHKQRWRDKSVAPHLRLESAHWLIDHGFIGVDGKEILPNGELPK